MLNWGQRAGTLAPFRRALLCIAVCLLGGLHMTAKDLERGWLPQEGIDVPLRLRVLLLLVAVKDL